MEEMVQVNLKQPNIIFKNKFLYFCTIYLYSKNVVIRQKVIFNLILLNKMRSKYHIKLKLNAIFINNLEYKNKINLKAILKLLRKPIYASNITNNWN